MKIVGASMDWVSQQLMHVSQQAKGAIKGQSNIERITQG